ncbi:hypothetical protein [Listeria cornellensis]
MKKALWKDIWREIAKSKGRFISIFLLIALGVAFFCGLESDRAGYDQHDG